MAEVPLGLMGEVRGEGRCLCAQPGTAKHHERAVLGHLGTRDIDTFFFKVKSSWNCINSFNCIHRRRLQKGPELFFSWQQTHREAQNLE